MLQGYFRSTGVSKTLQVSSSHRAASPWWSLICMPWSSNDIHALHKYFNNVRICLHVALYSALLEKWCYTSAWDIHAGAHSYLLCTLDIGHGLFVHYKEVGYNEIKYIKLHNTCHQNFRSDPNSCQVINILVQLLKLPLYWNMATHLIVPRCLPAVHHYFIDASRATGRWRLTVSTLNNGHQQVSEKSEYLEYST